MNLLTYWLWGGRERGGILGEEKLPSTEMLTIRTRALLVEKLRDMIYYRG